MTGEAGEAVRQSQVQAITATQAAIAIVIAIVGTAILFVVAYCLFARYKRKKRRERRIAEERVRKLEMDSEKYSLRRTLSTFQAPPTTADSDAIIGTGGMGMAGARNTMRSMSRGAGGGDRERDQSVSRKSTSSRKTMLIYDTEHPDRPPMVGMVEIRRDSVELEKEEEIRQRKAGESIGSAI